MVSAKELAIDALTQCCAEETEKYRRGSIGDGQYCFELFYRALAEDVPEAFTQLYQIYQQQVIGWVYRHGRFPQTGESADFFVSWAFRSFYFSLRGPKFARFPSLAHVLSYLKACVHTAIAQYLRDQPPVFPMAELPEVTESLNLGEQVEAQELWQQISQLLPDPHDQLLARCTFVLGMRPREIVDAYADVWPEERGVSVALYRIRRTLRRSAELRQRAGLE